MRSGVKETNKKKLKGISLQTHISAVTADIMKDINQTAEGGDVLPEVTVGVITENAQLSLLRTRRELSPHNMPNCLFSSSTHFLSHPISHILPPLSIGDR